jgi:Tol biopolymer transport system component
MASLHGVSGVVALVALAAAGPAHAAATERISVNSAGVQANAVGNWWYLAPAVSLSSDGRLAAFSSDATNLVRRDRNRLSDVFVRDRERGRTTRVSVTTSGREANGFSYGPALTANGRFVAFLSEAPNLAKMPRRRTGRFVYVRDRVARKTVRVDVSSSGRGGRGNAWAPPSISADGRFVAFTSDAQNLVPGDHDDNADAFVHDMVTGATTSVSLGREANRDYEFSAATAISGDGRHVLVISEAPLAPGGTPDMSNAYLHDRLEGTTIWLGASGADIFDAARGAVSADGSVVAFEGRAEASGVVVWDRASRTIGCLSCWDGKGAATWDAVSGMSADGRRVAFTRQVNRGGRYSQDVYVRDRVTGRTDRISVAEQGGTPDGPSGLGGLSGDGRFAAFSSDATNLVPGDTNRRTDLFVRGPLW